MNAEQFSNALGKVNDKYIMEALAYARKRSGGWLKWGALAACFGLVLVAAVTALPGILKGPGSVPPPPAPDPSESVVRGDGEPSGTDSPQPSDTQTVVICWDGVFVNEATEMINAAPRYYDPELYAQETWGEAEIVDWYGWDLAPGYIPEGLSAGGRTATAGVVRERASGEIVQEQAVRSFWTNFSESGGPKSDDGIAVPTGFTVTASRLGILRCCILPVDESRTTDFGGVPVTLSHCSLPHGPFDPTQKDPSGLYNMPAGYYDVYVAFFTLDGADYEIKAQRMELEELVRIVASVINVPSGESFIVGSTPSSLSGIPDRGRAPDEYPDTVIVPGFELDEPGAF